MYFIVNIRYYIPHFLIRNIHHIYTIKNLLNIVENSLSESLWGQLHIQTEQVRL